MRIFHETDQGSFGLCVVPCCALHAVLHSNKEELWQALYMHLVMCRAQKRSRFCVRSPVLRAVRCAFTHTVMRCYTQCDVLIHFMRCADTLSAMFVTLSAVTLSAMFCYAQCCYTQCDVLIHSVRGAVALSASKALGKNCLDTCRPCRPQTNQCSLCYALHAVLHTIRIPGIIGCRTSLSG